jgi:hypothetical protein
MEIPLEIALVILLTIYLLVKGIFYYNRKISALNKEKEVKNEYKPKL